MVSIKLSDSPRELRFREWPSARQRYQVCTTPTHGWATANRGHSTCRANAFAKGTHPICRLPVACNRCISQRLFALETCGGNGTVAGRERDAERGLELWHRARFTTPAIGEYAGEPSVTRSKHVVHRMACPSEQNRKLCRARVHHGPVRLLLRRRSLLLLPPAETDSDSVFPFNTRPGAPFPDNLNRASMSLRAVYVMCRCSSHGNRLHFGFQAGLGSSLLSPRSAPPPASVGRTTHLASNRRGTPITRAGCLVTPAAAARNRRLRSSTVHFPGRLVRQVSFYTLLGRCQLP